MGMKLTKIHRVMEFDQSRWLKPYIDFNTVKRQAAKNAFEKDLFKLMSHEQFGVWKDHGEYSKAFGR